MRFVFLVLSFVLGAKGFAQLSTVTFESANLNSRTFTDQGVVFSINSPQNSFTISDGGYMGLGWNGTAPDNKFIDNVTNFGNVQFSLVTQDQSLFQVKSFYLFLYSSNYGMTNFSGGTLTITGKRNGATVFTVISNSGFNSNSNVNNGYTFIDLSIWGGANNANKLINEISISTNSIIDYVMLDAFKWYKYTNLSANIGSTPISCAGGTNGTAQISGLTGGIAPYVINWTPIGSNNPSISSLSAGTYICNITDNVGETLVKSVTLANPSPLVIYSLTNSPICLGDNIVVSSSNDANQVQWKNNGIVVNTSNSFSIVNGNKVNTFLPSQTGIYSALVSNANGCNTTSGNVIVNDATMAPSGTTQSLNISGSAYFKNACSDLQLKLTPSGATPISGQVTSKVWIENTQPSIAGTPFVRRHYEITPLVNAATATGRVTLYFSQADFDAFNSISTVALPTGPNDVSGIANLLIERRVGSTNDGSGLPTSYNGAVATINPADGDIIWNASANRWEISFDVIGFGGLIVKSMVGTLPVHWLTISAAIHANALPFLSWKVNEFLVQKYSIEQSDDGKYFITLGEINSQGDGMHIYQYFSSRPLLTSSFFRIKQVDKDGKFSYSSVLPLKPNTSLRMKVYPSPFNGSFNVLSTENQKGNLYSLSGKLLLSIDLLKGLNRVTAEAVPSGLYLFKTDNGYIQKMIKQ